MNAAHLVRGRHMSAAMLCFASFAPLFAQPVILVEHDPYSLYRETPWGLPEDVMERLARQAAEYEALAVDLECNETTQRVKYPRGRTSEGASRESTYMFALDDGSMVPVPVKGHGKSARRYGKSDAPPAHAWSQLFAVRNQPYIAYRSLGEVPHAFGRALKIQFRGAVPYSDGGDIRQWEGIVLLDPHTLQPLELDARPLHLWPRLERQRRKYVNSFNIAGFIRFKKKPMAERVHVRFGRQQDGMSLPVDADVERFELMSPDQAVVRSRLVTTYAYDSLDE